MSIQRLAHRIATVAAIRGKTLAGEAVRDSSVPPIDVAASEEPKPFISVYTDDQASGMRGLDAGRPSDTLSIVIEFGVTAQMTFVDNDGEEFQEPGQPPTDAQMEIMLDMIERQIRIALADDGNAWAEIWRRLHTGDPQYSSTRGASAERGIRFAGRQLTIEVRPLPEPPAGGPATGVWADLIAAVEADAAAAPLAPIVRDMIEGGDVALDWQIIRRSLALDEAEADSLLVSMADGAEIDDVVIDEINPAGAEPKA